MAKQFKLEAHGSEKDIKRLEDFLWYLKGDYHFCVNEIREPEPSPSWNRQEVLCEKWKPHFSLLSHPEFDKYKKFYTPAISCFYLEDDNTISEAIPRGWSTTLPQKRTYAPTCELAEEIVSIREGRWSPKALDRVFQYTPSRPELFSDYIWCKEYFLPKEATFLFPSPEQREAFIAKNKPKEEKRVWDFSVGDTVILKPDSPVAPRPQMIIKYFSGGIIGGTPNCLCMWFDKEHKYNEKNFLLRDLINISK